MLYESEKKIELIDNQWKERGTTESKDTECQFIELRL